MVLWVDNTNHVAGVQIDADSPVTQSMSGTLDPFASADVFNLGPASSSISVDDIPIRIDELAFWKDYVLSDDDKTFDWNGGAGRGYPLP